MPKGVWMYSPPSGGKKVPEHVRQCTQRRIEAFAAEHFAGRYRELAIRFRGQFCYVDALWTPILCRRRGGPCPPRASSTSRSRRELRDLSLRRRPTGLVTRSGARTPICVTGSPVGSRRAQPFAGARPDW